MTTPEQNQDLREIQKTIDLSFQVETFLGTDIGRYLIKRSDDEVAAAVEELKAVDPSLVEVVRSIQTRIRVAESVQYWLADAIQAGHNAAEDIMNKER